MKVREILKLLSKADELEPSHDVRTCVLKGFKERKGSLDEMDKRRNIKLMAESIIRVEDEIELRTDCKNRQQALLTLRRLRRMLEVEGWQ